MGKVEYLCKTKMHERSQDSSLNNPFMKGRLEVLRVQGREFSTGAGVYVRRKLTFEGKKSDWKK